MYRCDTHIKGDRAELIAQEYLIKSGYYVFNNICSYDYFMIQIEENIVFFKITILLYHILKK